MTIFANPRPRERHLLALALSALLAGICALLALPANAQEPFSPTRFSVEIAGEGPDVILIPGLSTTREVWRPHLAALEGHRVHLLQVRGFGEDAGVNAEGPIMQPLIDELARYIETNGIERPAIIGHSMGGFIAMSLGAQQPALPGRILIVDSLPWFAAITIPPGTEPDMAQIETQAGMLRSLMLSMYGRELPENANDATLSGYTVFPENLQTLRELTGGADPRVTGQLVYELMLGDRRADIAAITAPVSVIVPHQPGALTADARLAYYRQQYAALPSAELVLIDNAAHFAMVDQPEEFATVVQQFLAD